MNRKQIGQNICALRHQCGMTQAQLAKKLDISEDHISHVEIGSGSISTSLLIKICKTLGVTPNDVLAGEYSQKEYSDEDLSETVLSLEGMTPYNRMMFESIYEYIVGQTEKECSDID